MAQLGVGGLVEVPEAVKLRIIKAISDDLIISNAARHGRVTPETLKTWLSLGSDDVNAGLDTQLAAFYLDVREAQGKKISSLLDIVGNAKRNWQAAAWMLEKGAREDFGGDSYEYKELLELYSKLRDDLKRLTDNPIPVQPAQGVLTHGREMDSESDSEEQGRTA